MRRPLRPFLLVLPLLLLVTGCGDGERKGGERGGGSTSLAGLLRSVPDSEDNRTVLWYSNLERLRGGERASSAEDDLRLLLDVSADFSLPPSVAVSDPEFAAFAGFDSRAIDASIWFGTLPNEVTVLVGDMKSKSIERGLRSSPGGDAVTVESIDGVTFFSLGDEDSISIEERSAIRGLGEALRMAVDGDTLYWGRQRSLIDGCLAARGASSLADDPTYLAIATALDAQEVMNAAIFSPAAGEQWTVGGMGERFEGETSTVVVALQYGSEELAAAAAVDFRAHVESASSLHTERPWAETLTVTDARAEGSLMVATLTSTVTGIALRVVATEDNLLQF